MTDPLKLQVNEMMTAAANAEVPAEVRALAEQGITKIREAYDAWTMAARTGVQAMEEIVNVTQAATKAVGDKLVGQALANTEAAFAAAERLARAKTIPEVTTLQAKFAQDRISIAGTQGRELVELVAKVSTEAATAVGNIAKRATEAASKG